MRPSSQQARDKRSISGAVLARLCDLGAAGEQHGGAALAQAIALLAAEQCERLLVLCPAPTRVHRVATALACVDMMMRLYGSASWCLELEIEHARVDCVLLLSLVVARVVDGSRGWPTAGAIVRCGRWARAHDRSCRELIAMPLLRSPVWRRYVRRVQLLACTEGCLAACSFASKPTLRLMERLREAPHTPALLASVEARVEATRRARHAASPRRSARIAKACSAVHTEFVHC